jgi:glycosyltransferase involved in cell wall biosynthesis
METEPKKIKVLTISDHPLSPSGVGTQTKYFIVEMLKTGKFQFISLGGAIQHDNYQPTQMEEFKEDWTIFPVEGYGNQDTIRSVLRTHKPDMLWFMTDPRFFPWLWEMENEIRSLCPMIYYHVWDNYPYPTFNKIWYDSTDVIATISKVTSDIVRTVAPDVEEHYVPHAIPTELFKKLSDTERRSFRKQHFGIEDDHLLVFWNNRNARRKQSGSLIFWFDTFLKKLKKKDKDAKATLLLHTEPKDPNGQDLHAIINELGLVNKEVLISSQKIPPDALAQIYSAADCTINISDAEGFGLATFESLACETPVITTMTGGLQEQVTFVEKISQEAMLKRNVKSKSVMEYSHGLGLEPVSKAIIGSQEVPFIYEDRLSEKQVVEAFMLMHSYGTDKRRELGKAGRKHVLENYNFEKFAMAWEKILLDAYEKHGSWDTRKNYKSWELRVV